VKTRSQSNASDLAGTQKPGAPRGRRLRRLSRLLGRTIFLLFLFGSTLSLVSFFTTPAVSIGVRPESGVEIREISRLYPVTMARVLAPRTVAEIADAVKSFSGPVSIGGGRNSMGGQTATPNGLQVDMREFRGVVAFDPAAKTITVRSGTRWREVQEAIDPAGLAVKIMQTYNSFTVGGALSVNAHGRYVGQGPIIRSVRAITLVLADGRVVTASPTMNPELFYGAIGGYGALGVIADVTLELVPNIRVRRDDRKVPVDEYARHFRETVRNDPRVIFHNGDIYPPAYESIHSVSYRETDEPVTVGDRLLPPDQSSWTHRTAYRIITSWHAGRWIREHVVDPVLFLGNPITWRNYEASYDISELEPSSRDRETYVLQEYFVPIENFDQFVERMRKILRAHAVNAVNVSVRHALPDSGSLLAWAPNEVFAFVLYYKQGTDPAAQREVGRWTRELIDASLKSGGRYYLPYQPVATRRQFAEAYPRARELFALKRSVDPESRFTNTLWDLYQTAPDGTVPPVMASRMPAALPPEARIALDRVPGYARDESAELLTHPEWDLVYSSDAYARWLARGKRPSAFPYVGCVGTFWRSYYGAWRAGHARYSFPIGQHVVLGVIGLSTAIEYGLKGLYEGTIGRLSELNMPPGGTAEDRYATRIAAEYVDLIAKKGWYEFDFGGAFSGLWTAVPLSGPGGVRKWERRFFLSAEYGIKAGYAAIIGLATRSVYAGDEMQRGVVAAGWTDSLARALPQVQPASNLDRGYTLLRMTRYDPFRDALLALSEHSNEVRLAELCGSQIVTISGTAAHGWQAPAQTSVVVAYGAPADPGLDRILLLVSARDLLDVLHALRDQHAFQIGHVYDY
jgi:FAD/FMN-containing dehydrogenase